MRSAPTCPGPGPTIPRPGQGGRVPDKSRGLAAKPELARAMITRPLDAGVPAAWVAGDEVCGATPGLRSELEPARSATCRRSPATTRCLRSHHSACRRLLGQIPPPATAGVLGLRCEKAMDLPGKRQERLGVNSTSFRKSLKGFVIPPDTVLVERPPM